MTTRTETPGQALTAEIRKMLTMNSRTRWGRKHAVMGTLTRDAIIERLWSSINYRGYDNETRTAIFAQAHTTLCAYAKFINGYRINGTLRFHIMAKSPWEFAAFLGEMVDTGCTNMGEFERWFDQQTREVRTALVAA